MYISNHASVLFKNETEEIQEITENQKKKKLEN